ncbi:hypothetical protein E2C01_078544 [Portunus trituberculatus]|uniref:Uncharacterized protein n=1 Tax=Portunus trituberculatus TaxID=210409 RepID=A0A5B7IN49_PORTR|nr:hypothetical protein [Portunus trituberculatus]
MFLHSPPSFLPSLTPSVSRAPPHPSLAPVKREDRQRWRDNGIHVSVRSFKTFQITRFEAPKE